MPLVDLPDGAELDAASGTRMVALPAGAQLDHPGGVTRNLAAGGNEFIAGALGAPVDAMTALLNLRTSIANAANAGKRDVAPSTLIDTPFGGSGSLKSAMGVIGADPRNVGANDRGDAVARAIGTGAVGMAAPYMAGRAMIARGVEGLPGAVGTMLGGTAPADAGILRTAAGAVGNAAIGGAAGAGGYGAEALLPEGSPYRPLANFAGQLAGGGLMAGGMGAAKGAINMGGNLVRTQFDPLSEAGRRASVGRELYAGADNPRAALDALSTDTSELVRGSMPTTFQLAGDQGIGQLERGQRTVTPAPFLERMGEQNEARVGALGALAPEGAAPSTVRDYLAEQLRKVNDEGDANVMAARQNAQQAFDQTGGRLAPEDMGAFMRAQLEAAKATTKRQESALWQAIDPNETLTINARPVQQDAMRIIKEIPQTARQPEGEELAVLGFAKLAGTAMPFSDFTALRGRLLQAIRDERENGQTPALRRMQQLRSSMDDAISNAAENAAQQEAQTAARGAGTPEQSMLGRVQSWAQGWRDARAGETADQGVSRQNASGGAGRVSSMGQRQGQGGGGFGNAAGAEGLPSGEQPIANFDAEAAARYRAAADATRERAGVFNNQIVGPALQERGNEYRLLASQVPERFIASPEGVQAFLNGGGTPGTLHDALVADLRRSATNPDGSLNVNRYQSWTTRRADALRAFPDLQQKLSNVAGAQESVDGFIAGLRQQKQAFEQSAARHFLNAEPTQAVQSALGGKNPVGDMAQLARLVGPDADAKAGLKRSVADYMTQRLIGNIEAGTSGANAIKANAFQEFVKRYQPALASVFDPNELVSLQQVAADLTRSNRSIAGSKIPGSPGTAQDLMAAPTAGRVKSALAQAIWNTSATGFAGFLLGGPAGAGVGMAASIGKSALDALRRTGLESREKLMTEALLNPGLARSLMIDATPKNRPIIAQRLSSQLGTLGAVAEGDQIGR